MRWAVWVFIMLKMLWINPRSNGSGGDPPVVLFLSHITATGVYHVLFDSISVVNILTLLLRETRAPSECNIQQYR